MENNNDKTMDRRSFLRGTTLASTGAALGAITLAGQASASGLTVKPQTDLEYDQVASAEVKVSASLSEAEIAKLPRVKQKMVAPPFAPEHDQVAKGGPKVVEVTLTVEEMPWKLDDEAEIVEGNRLEGRKVGAVDELTHILCRAPDFWQPQGQVLHVAFQ
mgnify:CR=1 FL=1